VLGSTTGVAPAAGVIGERISGSAIASSTTFTGTEGDAGNTLSTITLTAGTWEVKYSVSIGYQTGSSSGNYGSTSVFITDNSNNRVTETSRSIGIITRAAAANNFCDTSAAASTTVNISGSASYKLRGYKVDSSGTGVGTAINSGNNTSEFYAIRIG
jgi:hypothetical protein